MLKKNNNNIIKNIYFLEFLDITKKNTKKKNKFINLFKLNLKNELIYTLNEFSCNFSFSQKIQKFLINFYNNPKLTIDSKNLNEINIYKNIFNYTNYLNEKFYYVDDFLFTNYLVQLKENVYIFLVSSYYISISLKKTKNKKYKIFKTTKNKKKKKVRVNKIDLFTSKFIKKKPTSLIFFKNKKNYKFKILINKLKKKKAKLSNYLLIKKIYKKNKIIKKLKFITQKSLKIKKIKFDNYFFFKKIKNYNIENNILLNLIDNLKSNIDYNYKNKKKFSIIDYLFLNKKNLEKYYLNFYLETLPNYEKKTNNLKIKNHFIDFYINNLKNKTTTKNDSAFSKNKNNENYNENILNSITVDPSDVYTNHKTNIFKNENITFFFNFKNSRLTTFRAARVVHWQFFKKQKKINSRKYTNFLNYFLKKNNKYLLNILNFFIFKFNLSFNFLSDFMFTYMFFFKKKIKYNEVYQLPIDYQFWTILKKKSLEKLKIDSKINQWSLKTQRINSTFWMEKKKKNPYFLKKKSFLNNTFNNSIQYDFLTNYFIIFKKNNFIVNHQELIFKNKFLKLNNYKYKS